MSRMLLITIVMSLLVAQQTASAWTLNHDFNALADGGPCGNWDAADGSTVSSSIAYGGGKSCRMSVTGGESAYGEWGGVIPHPTFLRRGDQIWVRLRTYMPSGFNYDSYGEGNHLKFVRVHTRSSTTENFGYDDIYINPKGRMPPFLFIYEGEQVWSPIGNESNTIVLGTWETYEFYVRLDTTPAARGGMARVRFWKNGRLLLDDPNRVTLRSEDGYSDRTHIFTYWNGTAPATQHMYVDDLVVTSDTPAGRDAVGNPFVGVGAPPLTPSAPSSLTVN